uniref:Uncharacterized protein n=1 Tax=Oryza nivara TaxID=4536 RepID=A0A0E0G7J4_ORYNI
MWPRGSYVGPTLTQLPRRIKPESKPPKDLSNGGAHVAPHVILGLLLPPLSPPPLSSSLSVLLSPGAGEVRQPALRPRRRRSRGGRVVQRRADARTEWRRPKPAGRRSQAVSASLVVVVFQRATTLHARFVEFNEIS